MLYLYGNHVHICVIVVGFLYLVLSYNSRLYTITINTALGVICVLFHRGQHSRTSCDLQGQGRWPLHLQGDLDLCRWRQGVLYWLHSDPWGQWGPPGVHISRPSGSHSRHSHCELIIYLFYSLYLIVGVAMNGIVNIAKKYCVTARSLLFLLGGTQNYCVIG